MRDSRPGWIYHGVPDASIGLVHTSLSAMQQLLGEAPTSGGLTRGHATGHEVQEMCPSSEITSASALRLSRLLWWM